MLYAHSKFPPTDEIKQSPLAPFRFTLIRKLKPHSAAVFVVLLKKNLLPLLTACVTSSHVGASSFPLLPALRLEQR